jgi:hypothetical protein
MKKIVFLSCIITANFSFAQLRVNNNGDVIVRYGAFSPTSDAILYLGDQNHYIKSKFGYGLSLGTAGAPESIKIPQYTAKVGIYREPSYCLDVNGQVRSTQYLLLSDSTIKTNIEPLSSYGNKLYQLRPVSYNYEAKFDVDVEFKQKRHFGFLAQQLNEVYPELVYTDSSKIMSIDYIALIPVLVAEVQNQNNRINELQEELAKLKSTSPNLTENKNLGYLSQNSPNPFNIDTKINYYVPTDTREAQILIYDMSGIRQTTIDLKLFGSGSTTVSANGLNPGSFVYALSVNGVVVDSKIMIVTQ